MISLQPADSGNNLLRVLNEVMMTRTEREALNGPTKHCLGSQGWWTGCPALQDSSRHAASNTITAATQSHIYWLAPGTVVSRVSAHPKPTAGGWGCETHNKQHSNPQAAQEPADTRPSKSRTATRLVCVRQRVKGSAMRLPEWIQAACQAVSLHLGSSEQPESTCNSTYI